MQQKTTTGEVKGKLQYMAPEQLASNRVDRRADIFALGCVLYECTLGQGPFVGEGLSIMYKIMEGDVPPPKSINPNYPDALEAVLMKALAKDPNQRYSTAEEFRVALEGWIASTGNAVTDLDVAAWVKTTAGGKLDERMKRVRDMCDRLDNGEIVTAADANLPANLMSNGGTQTNVRANDTDVAANSAVTNSGILVHDVPNAEGYDGMAPAYAAPAAPRFGAGLVAAIAVVVVALVGIGAVVVVSRASVPPSSAAAAPSVVTVQAPPQVPAVAPVPPPAQPAVAPTPAPAAAPAEAAPSKTSKTSKKKSKSAEASDTGDERPAPSPKKKAKVIDQENPF
jgi:serine/threonine-protein kinase